VISLGVQIIVRERPVPLVPRITDEDRAVHRQFVGTLGESAIWRDYIRLD